MGWLVALEGIDGSGKGTQAEALQRMFLSEGRTVERLGFPRYEETFFGQRIGDFLNGRFGSLNEVPPFFASLLYAGDRLESKAVLDEALQNHEIVILDRYVPSNIAHQAAKLTGQERDELIQWIEYVEYDLYRLPRPDRVILFDLPETVSRQLVARKAARGYTDQEADLQEADSGYQAAVRALYLEQAAAQASWYTVSVCQAGEPRPVDEIAREVRAHAL